MLSVDRLVEVLWGDEPPEAATSSLHAYVSRLRRLLPPSVRLETAAPGYRLRLDAGSADVERFEAALGEALACLAERPEAALAGLEAALSCWRGDAFAEFAEEWWAQGEAARLEELRLHAREAHAEALLGLGRSEAAVSEARAVTADHPSRERAWRILVIGLHRCGRQRDALRAAGEYRARLRDESGLDPSKDFAALEHAVAADDPSEHVVGSSFPLLRTGRSRVGNLAPSATSFVGRAEELARLVAELPARPMLGNLPRMRASLIGRDRETDDLVGLLERAWLVTVTGVGGVGKTRLAVEAAGRVTSRFPDGVWLVELASALTGGDVGVAVASTLGIKVPAGRAPAESVVDALEGQRVLVLLDNCEHVLDAVADLVAGIGARHHAVVILATSREAVGVPGERIYPLRSLDVGAAARLFDCRLEEQQGGIGVTADEWPIVEELCRRLDGLPLAVELAAARARSIGVADLTARLA